MKVLTVWQPWASAIAIGAKLVENRTWKPTPGLLKVGDYVGIHAAVRKWSQEDAVDVADRIFRGRNGAPAPAPFGDVVTYRMWFEHLEANAGKLVAIARVAAFVEQREDLAEAQQKWWVGPIGWLLDDVRRLPQAITIKGAQGLWDLPNEVLVAARAQLRKAA